jgi:hypothetical protein
LKLPRQEIGDTETKSGLVLRWLPQQGSGGSESVSGLLQRSSCCSMIPVALELRVGYCTDAAAAARIEWSWNYEWFIAAMQLPQLGLGGTRITKLPQCYAPNK